MKSLLVKFSPVQGTVVSWDPCKCVLQVQNIIPFNTGNINVGIGGFYMSSLKDGTIETYFFKIH
ncbi:MAG: hypothetical protein CM15mV41_1160 [Caudoviricetes sp.]|nr:MAG: hypothetical protein CM15mV41_1160 [Caudoviricetes sp.]